MQILIQYLILILIFSPSFILANDHSEWDKVRFHGLKKGVSYKIQMGSGFFINRNYIVTNRHVVDRCKNIAVRGAVAPTLVKLIKLDNDLDLALLYSQSQPRQIPYLRINYSQIEKNDLLFTVGYPLDRGESGNYIIRDAKVIDINRNPNNGFSNIIFTDVIDHGNSGGPILDKNSNISGVVTAKIKYYKDDKTTPEKSIGIAIGLDGLIDFLRENHIFFAANATYDIFTNYNPDSIVRDYVVNIHCIIEN